MTFLGYHDVLWWHFWVKDFSEDICLGVEKQNQGRKCKDMIVSVMQFYF